LNCLEFNKKKNIILKNSIEEMIIKIKLNLIRLSIFDNKNKKVSKYLIKQILNYQQTHISYLLKKKNKKKIKNTVLIYNFIINTIFLSCLKIKLMFIQLK
jgi:hypothetical protein